MKKTIEYLSVLLTAMLCLASCADSANMDYTPGQPTADGCMKVYFDSSNPEDFINEPGTVTSIDIKVSRVDTAQAAEIPVTCKSADEGLTIPSSVKFGAGQKTATLTVTFGALEASKKYNFSLAIPEEYVDHYSKLDGASAYSSYVMDAAWADYIPDDTIYVTSSGSTYEWIVPLQRLGQTDRYRVQDFLGSGLAFTFTIGDAATVSGYNKIEPTGNYYNFVDTDYGVTGFYLWDTAGDKMAEFALGSKTVTEMAFMRQYGTTDYSYISFKKGFAQIGTYYTTYADGTYEYYNYVYMYFKPQK